MKFFQFDDQLGKHVTHYDSNFFIQPVTQLDAEARISLAVLQEDGVIGNHQTDLPQLLLVLEGEGTVRAGTESKRINKGIAVLWSKGEWHEPTTERGLTALVIESKKLGEDEVLLKMFER